MLNVLRNNYLRMFKRLPITVALILVTLVSLLLGVYISGQQIKGHIAVVYKESAAKQLDYNISNDQKSIDTALKEQLSIYEKKKTAAKANAIAKVKQAFTGEKLTEIEAKVNADVDRAFDKQIPVPQIVAMRKIVELPVLDTLSSASQKLSVLKKFKSLSMSLPNAAKGLNGNAAKTFELENYAIIQYVNVPKNRDTKYLDISIVPSEPPISALLQQKYNAIIIVNGTNTGYTIKTLQNDSFKDKIKRLINNQNAASLHLNTDRNAGETITGFILLFLLLSIFSMLFTLSDDKEKGILTRLSTTPMKLPAYLAAQMLYAFTTMIPSYIALIILQLSRINIGLTLFQFALIYLSVSIFGIPLALWFITIFQSGDDASLFGNSILVLSTVLSGAFISINNNNSIFNSLISYLPQKQILNFADNLHNGTAISHPYPVIYILAAGILLFVMAVINLHFQTKRT